MEYIYVLKCNEYYKIGKTTVGMKERLNGLKTSIPYDYSVKFLFGFDVLNVSRLEKNLHRNFIKKHIRGEWFLLNENELEDLCAVCISAGGILKDYKTNDLDSLGQKKYILNKGSSNISIGNILNKVEITPFLFIDVLINLLENMLANKWKIKISIEKSEILKDRNYINIKLLFPSKYKIEIKENKFSQKDIFVNDNEMEVSNSLLNFENDDSLGFMKGNVYEK